jgi:guanylate kinase
MSEQHKKAIILTAPSGAGKTSITRFLLANYPQLAFSVSATTRAPRGAEQDGVIILLVQQHLKGISTKTIF